MDRKSIIVLVVSFALLLLWPWLINRIFPPKRLPPGATNVVAAATKQVEIATNILPTIATNLAPSLVATALVLPPGAREELETLENENALYTFSSFGGGLKAIELKKYPESTCGGKTNSATQKLAKLNTGAPAPVGAVLGNGSLQGDGIFKLTKTGNIVRADKALTNGLSFVKEFGLG